MHRKIETLRLDYDELSGKSNLRDRELGNLEESRRKLEKDLHEK